jgi:hypothetical protein
MRPLAAILATAAALAGPGAAVRAEGDPMEVQRCVWRCLAGSPGADSREYNDCVLRLCSGSAAGPAPQSPRSGWSGGVTADGRGRYAAARDPGTGNDLYVICAAGGQGWLMLNGPEGPSARLMVVVDGAAHALDFAEQGGGYYAPAAPDSAVVLALMQGRRAGVVNGVGTALGDFDLAGAGAAIGAALQGCR